MSLPEFVTLTILRDQTFVYQVKPEVRGRESAEWHRPDLRPGVVTIRVSEVAALAPKRRKLTTQRGQNPDGEIPTRRNRQQP
jgi:hypothetical protein